MTKTLSIMYTLKSYCLRGLREGEESQIFTFSPFCVYLFINVSLIASSISMFLVLSMFPIGLRLDSLPLSDNLSLAAAIFIFHRKREKNRNGKVSNSEIFLIQFLPVFYSLRSSIQRFLRSSIQRFFIQFI